MGGEGCGDWTGVGGGEEPEGVRVDLGAEFGGEEEEGRVRGGG